MQKSGFKPNGCGLIVLLVVGLLVVQYVGAIIGLAMIGAAVYARKKGPWQDEHHRLTANVVIGVGIALCVGQGVLLYGKYKDAHPDALPIASGPIPVRFRGTWSPDLASCNDRYSRMRISEKDIEFESVSLTVDKAVSRGKNTLIVNGTNYIHGRGDIYLQKSEETLILSQDGRALTIGESTSVRCPAPSTSEVDK